MTLAGNVARARDLVMQQQATRGSIGKLGAFCRRMTAALFFCLALPGCATPKGENGPAPSRLRLSQGKHSVQFNVPPGWHAERLGPEQGFYTLKRDGAWQPVAMSVSFSSTPYRRSRTRDDYAEQFSLSEQFLHHQRAHNFPQTGITCDGHFNADSGRVFWLFLEVSNQPHLFAFVPERDCVIQFCLYGDLEDIVASRQEYYAVLNSYRFQ